LSANSGLFLDGLARRYRSALTRFFERHASALRSESEDMTQEVFVRLAQRELGNEINHVEGYLFQTASSVLTDRMRRRRTRKVDDHVEYDDGIHVVEDFAPDRVLIGREEVERVVNALGQLPERTRAAFVLHRFEGLKHAEIARRLGVSVSAVEKHVMRALKHVSSAIRDSE
jgi:RNA polymerase sigma-70 factor (ECF subfamily)